MLKLIATIVVLFCVSYTFAQGCCSGGAGSPLSGTASVGVLKEGLLEPSYSHQYLQSNRFMSGKKDTIALFNRLSSNYHFLKLEYGVSKQLTVSFSMGYFDNKTLVELDGESKMKSVGLGDFIFLPRYRLIHLFKNQKSTELAVGIGFKTPIGSHTDSSIVYISPNTGRVYYAINPPTVQPSNGSNDLMLYSSLFRHNTNKSYRFMVNTLYIKKGWNSLGQKFGDYLSLGLYGGATFFKKLGVMTQIKGEYIAKMEAHKDIDMLALYNIDITSTGSQKVFFVPQVSYSFKSATFFVMSEIPIYQNMRGIQIASQYNFSVGLSYQFQLKKGVESDLCDTNLTSMNDSVIYTIDTLKVWGNCSMCKQTIETKLLKKKGVVFALWDKETKLLTVKYDGKKTDLPQISVFIASLGYDTAFDTAPDSVYEKLHSCCKYTRK